MKSLISVLLRNKLLNEVMKPTVDDTFTEKSEDQNLILISTDNGNDKEHYLVLGVDLVNKGRFHELGYGFSVMDKNLNIVTPYMRTRAEVSKYLPPELKGKIMPKIIDMTINLVNKNKPKIIVMEAMEHLEGDSLKRHEKILDTLIDLGYVIKEGYPKKNSEGKLEWILLNGSIEEHLNEETILEFRKKQRDETTKILEDRYKNLFKDEEFKKKFIKEQITNNKHFKK